MTRLIFSVVLIALCLGASHINAGEITPSTRIKNQIAAGEFGPAIDAALKIKDPVQRTQMLQQVAAAQRVAGELDSAMKTSGLIPNTAIRANERSTTLRQQSANGGGARPNFQPLMDLLTSTIEPDTWDANGGAGTAQPFNTGVRVDPTGQLRLVSQEDKTNRLDKVSQQARQADLHEEMARSSKLRYLSLTRLEQEIAQRLAAGEAPQETMKRLAGLTQVQYVFVFPAEKELVIAGPAEGWKYDETGRAVGLESGKPMLHLDDLVTVLRTFAPGGKGVFGCSINTRDENLKQVKEYVEKSNSAGPLRPGQLGKWVKDIHDRLGLQDVVVYGVPHDSRVAQVLVEADYRMKLIGVAKLEGGKNIPDYFSLLQSFGQTSGGGSLDALRWWLTMKYGSIVHNTEKTVFEIRGSSVLVQSENQFVNSQGQHLPTGKSEPVNRKFAENFTNHYQELALRDKVFADLNNVFDLGMVAALYRHEGLAKKLDWNLGVFAPNGTYKVAEVRAPKTVDSVVNHRVYNGKDIVVQVAGGVQAPLLEVVQDKNLNKEDANLPKTPVKELPAGRWWWDAPATPGPIGKSVR